eukprot:gene4654-4907_t
MTDAACENNQSPARVIFFSTSVPALQKVRADIATITRVFEAKKVVYEEVDLTSQPERREEMLKGSNYEQRSIPQVHVNGLGTCSAQQQLLQQQVADLTLLLKQSLTHEVFSTFWQDWDTAGGCLCSLLRESAAELLQAGDAATVSWPELLFCAEALQEVCWEKLHTGYWMDVQLVSGTGANDATLCNHVLCKRLLRTW